MVAAAQEAAARAAAVEGPRAEQTEEAARVVVAMVAAQVRAAV